MCRDRVRHGVHVYDRQFPLCVRLIVGRQVVGHNVDVVVETERGGHRPEQPATVPAARMDDSVLRIGARRRRAASTAKRSGHGFGEGRAVATGAAQPRVELRRSTAAARLCDEVVDFRFLSQAERRVISCVGRRRRRRTLAIPVLSTDAAGSDTCVARYRPAKPPLVSPACHASLSCSPLVSRPGPTNSPSSATSDGTARTRWASERILLSSLPSSPRTWSFTLLGSRMAEMPMPAHSGQGCANVRGRATGRAMRTPLL